MKKKFFIPLIICALILSLFGISACKYDGVIKNIEVVSDLGSYDGYRVELWHIEFDDADYTEDEVSYYVDDTYICTLPDGSYKIVVDGNYDLSYAYKISLINHDDLLTIAERAQEALDESYEQPPINGVAGLTAEQISRMEQGYASYRFLDSTERIEIVHYLGSFDNRYVVILKYLPPDSGVAAVVVPVYLDSYYICSLPDPSYKIVIFNSRYTVDGYLQDEYDRGLISQTEVSEIAHAAQKALGEIEDVYDKDDDVELT